MKIVIVGGVAGGASAAARLRRLDESAEIVVFERDRYVSFANCGLPYHIGGEIPDRSSLLLQTPDGLARQLALDVRVDHEVTAIDRFDKQVEVRDHAGQRTFHECYDKLVLCPGAEPIRLKIPGADHPRVLVLRNIPDMDRIIAAIEHASRAVVIGGSYIGIELAEAFRARGVRTTIIERTAQLMPWLDHEMTRILHLHVRDHGVEVRLGTEVTHIHGNGALGIELSDGTSLEADLVVMAAGVTPNVSLAREAGLKIGPRGGIVVDRHMRTSDPDIFAAGDVVETPHLITGEPTLALLASPANRQGRIAAETICGRDSLYRGTQGTAVVKAFEMTVGGTGVSEAELHRRGMEYRKIYLHPNDHASYYPGASPMFFKVLFEPERGRLLGAQVLGWRGVDKRIDVLSVAMRAGMTVYDLEHLELAYAPPYGSAKDPVNMAGFLAANLLRGDVHLWYPEEYPDCAHRVTIVDARTPAEYERWHIRGAVLIPHTEQRARLDELPRDRPVYLYCRSGFRSYLSYALLKHHGFADVAFLSGGLLTYHGFHETPFEGLPVGTLADDAFAPQPVHNEATT
jgi:NADPH-dependent 2,4-dienoyl-CoA reductase/sulfur reductase-like enzyme/rhodanese-related sulfurtransferase